MGYVEVYVGDLVRGVAGAGVDDEVGELEGCGEDDFVEGGDLAGGGCEVVGVGLLLGNVGYCGVEVGGDGGGGFEHVREDFPVAAGDGHGLFVER